MPLPATMAMSSEQLEANEVLAFLQHAIDTMNEISIIQISKSNFTVEKITTAKKLLYKTLDQLERIPSRRRNEKGEKSIQDIINLLKTTDPDNVRSFVAKNLNKLPSVTFDHVDVTRLLKDITLKASLAEVMLNLEASQDTIDNQSFDFIIVGGGTAGCVLANRLSEANATILLVEAGGLPGLISDVPGFFPITFSPENTWGFKSVNDGYTSQEHKTNSIDVPQGKMLGGTSSLNYMFYVRGNKEDYDNWASLGNEGWEWDKVFPYFKRAENFQSQDILESNSSCLHGTEGFLGINQLHWKDKTEKILKAFQENGHKILEDSNDHNNNIGYSEPQFTIADDIRQSTAVAYIRPIKDKPNLYLILNSMVAEIITKDRIAIGIKVTQKDKQPLTIKANKEIIVSAGAINTPKLLMLSGIGPKKHLEKHKIKVVLDSPQVGQNLHDHPLVIIGLTGEKDPLSKFENFDVLKHLKSFPTPVIFGRIALDKKNKVPDYQMNILPVPADSPYPSIFCEYIIGLNAKVCTAQTMSSLKTETVFAALALLHGKSRGRIELINQDPNTPPHVYTGYYSDKEDLQLHVKCLADYISILNTTYFKKHNSEIIKPEIKRCEECTFLSEEYWKCYILNLVDSMWDFAGTCSMGPEGVVDSRLKVRGIKKLRVVDASVIPTTISGNLNAAVIMLAEKGSDIIKVDHGYIKKKGK